MMGEHTQGFTTPRSDIPRGGLGQSLACTCCSEGCLPEAYSFPSDSIDGLEWIVDRHSTSGRPSIATMSFGGSPSLVINDAVRKVGVSFSTGSATHNTCSLPKVVSIVLWLP
jgi:hypothetical protein